MSFKSLLGLPLLAVLAFFTTGSVSAEPLTHTMTINNGGHVIQKTFVFENGEWHELRCDAPACSTPCRTEETCSTGYRAPARCRS